MGVDTVGWWLAGPRECTKVASDTFSLLSTIFWTIRSTRSNSGHILVHVPTGVMA